MRLAYLILPMSSIVLMASSVGSTVGNVRFELILLCAIYRYRHENDVRLYLCIRQSSIDYCERQIQFKSVVFLCFFLSH
jgi:hypothetical protein